MFAGKKGLKEGGAGVGWSDVVRVFVGAEDAKERYVPHQFVPGVTLLITVF